jgi:hypothetical protein
MLSSLKKLCTPAMIYFVISISTLLVMILFNIGNTSSFCMGEYEWFLVFFPIMFYFIVLGLFMIRQNTIFIVQ